MIFELKQILQNELRESNNKRFNVPPNHLMFFLSMRSPSRTCGGHKKLPLTADYPKLCSTLLGVDDITSHCGKLNRWRMKDRNVSRIVEQEIFNYARENLAVINIFIKARFDL